MKLIRLDGIEKTYWLGRTPVRALRGVSLAIAEGEFVAIMGASGSGKSTLMHILGLLDSYDDGTYHLDREEVSRFNDDELALLRARSIGFVFQQFNLLPRLDAGENMELPLAYASGHAHADPKALIRSLDLASRLKHRPGELSGGQQQRVAIGRALMNQPRLILADEPTGNLDSVTQREIMDLLVRLNRSGLTIILVTHETDISRYARRAIWMRDGRIVSDRRQRGTSIARRRFPALARGGAQPVSGRRTGSPLLGSVRSHVMSAMRSLAANKLRTVLSTLGITIGVGAVIAMLALGAGAREDIQKRLARFGTNMISVSAHWHRSDRRGRATGVTRLTVEDAKVLKKAHPGIKRTAPVLSRNGVAVANGREHSTRVTATTPEYAEMRDYRPVAGRFFTERDNLERARVCLLGRTVASELFEEGENPIGKDVRLNRIPFTVIGVLPEKGSGGRWDPDDQIMMPISTGMYRFAGSRYINAIDVEVASDVKIDRVIASIQSFLSRRYRIPGDNREPFRVRNEVAIREAFSETTSTMSWLLGMIGGISLLVGGIGIMNIMLVSVTERTREIGLRKAVGARRQDILSQFLIEATAISVIGGLLGIVLGAGVALSLAVIVNWAVSVTLFSVILAFGFSAAVGVGFGFMPARRAALLHPSEALRYE